jgi:hypothetical protein
MEILEGLHQAAKKSPHGGLMQERVLYHFIADSP